MNTSNLGVLSTGVYLPPQIRGNNWWPAEVVRRWMEKKTQSPFRVQQQGEAAPSRGAQLALDAMAASKDDPFGRVRERRVRPDGMKPSEMEIAAAKDAIQRAGIDKDEIGLILTCSQGTDTLLVSNAPLVHEALGLPGECIATGIDGVCNSLSLQLTFAESLIRSGRIRFALLVQSSTISDLLNQEESLSPLFGDAATALLVGPCPEGGGLLSIHHETRGSLYASLQIGNPNGSWHEAIPQIYIADGRVARTMAMNLGEYGQLAIRKALEQAGLSSRDLSFIATHQGTAWLREVTQTLIDAPQARSCDTFSWTGTVGPANVPLCLAMGEREGLLRKGDLVAGFTGGAGTTFAAFILRW